MPLVQYECELCGHVQVRITWQELPSIVCLKCRHGAYRIMSKSSSRSSVTSRSIPSLPTKTYQIHEVAKYKRRSEIITPT